VADPCEYGGPAVRSNPLGVSNVETPADRAPMVLDFERRLTRKTDVWK